MWWVSISRLKVTMHFFSSFTFTDSLLSPTLPVGIMAFSAVVLRLHRGKEKYVVLTIFVHPGFPVRFIHGPNSELLQFQSCHRCTDAKHEFTVSCQSRSRIFVSQYFVQSPFLWTFSTSHCLENTQNYFSIKSYVLRAFQFWENIPQIRY